MQYEDAAVPAVVAAFEICLPRPLVGLLVECYDAEGGAVEAFERRTLADVAVAGRGPRGHDPEGDEAFPLARDPACVAEVGDEPGAIADHVVGGKDHHDPLRVPGENDRGAERDAGGGVSSERLGDDGSGRHARELPGDQRGLEGGGDYDEAPGRHQPGNAHGRLLDHRPAPENAEELLRHGLPAFGPEPLPSPSRHDHRVHAPAGASLSHPFLE